MLDNTEEDKDMSWECHKVVDYCKEKGDVNSSNHKCLVEWNDVNKTKSLVNYDRLLQLHMLDQTEEDNDTSWECHKVVDYCKEKGDVNSSNQNVCWNGMMSIRISHG
jgi:hypothetical protein